ncbi:MAG: cytoplasmic protein [Alphaproteobacteria bacterium]
MQPDKPDTFDRFQASQLWCDHCKQTVVVRERLLLILPGSNLYEYLCSQCGHSLGKRTEPDPGNMNISKWQR